MSHALKNSWQPSASIENLQARAKIIKQLREFFWERNILEVTTPIVDTYGVTDPYIDSITTQEGLFLQTSPEYHMKRLLAAGSGAIFQITKSFRKEESGKHHNPEFTMLEWYRPDFDHHDLMNEMDLLLQHIVNSDPTEKLSYAECFEKHLGLNPHASSVDDLKNCAADNNLNPPQISDKDDWLHLLLTHLIEPKLGIEKPVFIFDYPASQSALAKIRNETHPVAERFEVYFKGIELANGYHELTDVNEQLKRFNKNNVQRKKMGKPEVPIDTQLIAALEQGLPKCAGVALGVDRLVMLALNTNSIHEVISF